MYKKLAILTLLVMIAPIVLAACGPTPEPVTIVETSVVVETVVVEVDARRSSKNRRLWSRLKRL